MREWLPAGHLVWFVLDVVERLDLTAFRARHRLGGVGREAYDPAMLLALLIYGYAVGERSSRRIQRLCGTDVAFRVICAQDVPDHSTIARFRQAHVEAFDDVFAQVLRLCARAGMGRLSTVAIDGTKIAANASIDANHGAGWFRERAREIAAEAQAAAAAEGRRLPGRRVTDPFGGKAMRKALAALQQALLKAATTTQNTSNTSNSTVGQRNLTDPDSRIMPTRKGWMQAYNAQFAVSADWLVLALALASSPADSAELVPMLKRTVKAAELINSERGEPEELGTALADAGYCSEANLTAPGPDRLIATGKAHQVAQQARKDPASGPPPEDATPIEAMRHRLRTPEGAALYKKRRATAETVHAHIKDRIGLRTFS